MELSVVAAKDYFEVTGTMSGTLQLGADVTDQTGKTSRDLLMIMSGVGLALLALQFFLGMFLNLFVSLPASDPFSAGASGVLSLGLHMANGFVLLGATIAMVFVARRTGDRRSLLTAALSAVSVGVALFGGLRFIFGGQDNIYSYVMATGFMVALLAQAYLFAQRMGRNHHPVQQAKVHVAMER